MSATTLAVFDLDGTLTVKRSLESSFILFLLRRQQLHRDSLLHCALFFLKHILRDPVCATKRNKMYLKGTNQALVEQWVHDFLRDQGDGMLYSEGVRLVSRHREQGHVTVLLTGSLSILVHPLCDLLNLPFDRIYATELEMNGNFFTGRINGAHYFGEGKKKIVEHLEEELATSLAGSFCYADSVSDLQMMHLFGYPIAVNPDKALESAARKNDWKIICL